MTPRPLLLVGAGGLAREVLAAVRLQPSEWKPIGALDDDPSKHGADLDGVPVLGGSEVAGELTDAAVVVCMAHARRPTGRLFASRGGSPCPMIDGLPSSTLQLACPRAASWGTARCCLRAWDPARRIRNRRDV